VEDRVRRVREPNEPILREYAADLLLEVHPVARPYEVVEDHEAALEHVLAKSGYLLVRRPPESGLAEVQHGVPEDLRIIEREDVASLHVHVHQAHFVEYAREVALSARVIVVPFQVTPPAAESSVADVEPH